VPVNCCVSDADEVSSDEVSEDDNDDDDERMIAA